MSQMQIFKQKSTNNTTAVDMIVDAYYAHSFAGVKYYNAQGTEVTPTSGNITITAKVATHEKYEDVTNGTIDATVPSQAQWSGNALKVKATPSGLSANVITYELVVVCNRT